MALALSHRTKLAGTTVLLFVLSLFLTAYSNRNREAAETGASFFSNILQPLQSINYSIADQIGGLRGNYLALVGVREENERLRSRLSGLEAQNSQLLEFRSENQRLRGILTMKEETGLEGVTANVIGYDPSNWVEAITIDQGSQSGIREGMAVVDGYGVVGQIISVGRFSSTVLLITDHSSGVDAIVQGNRARGVVEGLGTERCALRYVTNEDLRVGDRVITSGMDGIYPKGLQIGRISEIEPHSKGLFKVVQLKPEVRFSKLETVLVVTKQTIIDAPPVPGVGG